MPSALSTSSSAGIVCFHCGQPVPAGTVLFVPVEGIPRQMCCAGCQAVCEAIVTGGLADYYQHRQAFPDRGEVVLPPALAELGLFDHPEFQQAFVRPLAGGEREADLILEGITCAACVWLNERHLATLSGVVAVQVNYATRRARIRWREEDVRLSQILAAVAAIGYRAHPYDPQRSELLAQKERRTALWRLFVAGFGMMQVMMYAFPAYIAAEGDISVVAGGLMRWASMVLTLPVVLYSAAPFFSRAWRDLRLLRLGMDVPVALGVGAAFVASVWATLRGAGEVYFDSVTMFVFFLLGARYLEMLARQRATRGAETLGRLLPVFARRLSADGVVEEQVAVSSLAVGDVLLVRPGETIVADGVVRAGVSEVNEAWLTGESLPVAKQQGSRVLGGSLNGTGALEIEAQQVGEATRLATIRRLMERASAERPRIVAQADRVSLVFTVLLLVLAAGVGVYWWWSEPARALSICVAVLVVSCPCALSLATPVALTVATDALARAGLLVTRGHAIETLARANHFVFDKTGTLTTGRLRLVNVACVEGESRESVLALATALELHSEHAVARALVDAGPKAEVPIADEVRIHPGQGVLGQVKGVRLALGREDFVAELAVQALPVSFVSAQGDSVVFLAREGAWLAMFVLADSVRGAASALISGLRAEGCGISIFSGDGRLPVRALADRLGVEDARAELLPEGKYAQLTALQAQGKIVAMVGDGINDAPVLAQAQVSIAMAGGTELARNQADLVLLGDDLERLLLGRQIARKTQAIIRENLIWAFAYNLLAIPAAALGWVTPWMAGIGMGGSSLLVVLNALRIARRN
ncbi:heavy metal translocating P-type ATPase [Uliginosibacterium aquaticum]|uniref:heavy metal translocating P-type ATPase n=1 Tax=Uliginosibacterium aquaticum TaxID=2731212 RepID=UPI002E290A9D|nr:heavy metal translocating P-type ATPase [Uliginosibacterium aquaticum]